MSEAQHTPTPWFANPDDREGYEWNIHIVQESNRDMRVCFMTSGPEADPNSAFIVHAVNSHATLTAALREARGVLEGIEKYEPHEVAKDAFAYDRMVDGFKDCARTTLATINAALVRVEG